MKTEQTPETQKAKILDYLYGTFNKIDALQAWKIAGTMKLSTRLGEIEKEYNVVVKSERKPGSRYLRYWIESPKNLSV